MKIQTIFQTAISLFAVVMLLAGCSSGGGDAPASLPAATYTVTATAGAGGIITPGSQTIISGDTTQFTITPNTGYSISGVSGCNGALVDSLYTTGPVTADCTVTASFTADPPPVLHTLGVSASPLAGGVVTGGGTYSEGSAVTVTATANVGYTFINWTEGGTPVSTSASYDLSVDADRTVVANFSLNSYSVSATGGANGTITPATQSVNHGANATFTITPAAGYAAIIAGTCAVGTLSGDTYTSGAITADCTVTVTFDIAHTVTASAGANGTITPAIQAVVDGSTATFTVTPAEGFAASVSGCGGTLVGNTYTTTAVTADCAITATFNLKTYTVTATGGTGGTIAPVTQTVGHGTTTTFTVTPEAGYVASATGCGGALVGETYTTGLITANCAVSASFSPSLSIAPVSAVEGNSGTSTMDIVVTLSGPADSNVTASYTMANDTAVGATTCDAAVDYVNTSGTVTIPAGSTSGNISVTVCGDTLKESGDEAFTIVLSNVSANAILATASAAGTIQNDDVAAHNDTGITACSDDLTASFTCTGTTGQDGEYGRDTTANDSRDGPAGFSFTKLGSDGKPLADQSVDYATTPWSCVQDNVTGLMWEVKTADGGLHDKDWTYTWYNSTGSNDGGDPGTASGGSCGGVVTEGCDTEKYVAAINAVGWCGANDWRMPSVEELSSMANYGVFGASDAILPNTAGRSFWSGWSLRTASQAWSVHLGGDVSEYFKSGARGALAVRGGKPASVEYTWCSSTIISTAPNSRYTDHGDGTVSDSSTGLMWKKCRDGLSGTGCDIGTATPYNWSGALQAAATANTDGFAGYTDWRLPSIKELTSLVERACGAPAINQTFFPANVEYLGHYWSSSPRDGSKLFSWYQSSWGSAAVAYRTELLHVRLVRGGN